MKRHTRRRPPEGGERRTSMEKLTFYSDEEFEERLERIKKSLNEDTKKGDSYTRYPYLVGYVTAITEKAYTPEQLRRIFDLVSEA